MQHLIQIEMADGNTQQFAVNPGQSLLAAAEQCGLKPIPCGCRGGGCGYCKVAVLNGEFDHKAMSKAHIGEADLAQGLVLACRVYPKSDMRIALATPKQENHLVKLFTAA